MNIVSRLYIYKNILQQELVLNIGQSSYCEPAIWIRFIIIVDSGLNLGYGEWSLHLVLSIVSKKQHLPTHILGTPFLNNQVLTIYMILFYIELLFKFDI